MERINLSIFKKSAWDTILLCPKCGEDNLHQGMVEVFLRDGEPSDIGLRVTADGSGVSISRGIIGNPSPRGDGLIIHFECELCGPEVDISLTILQHKGSTFIGSNVTGGNHDVN